MKYKIFFFFKYLVNNYILNIHKNVVILVYSLHKTQNIARFILPARLRSLYRMSGLSVGISLLTAYVEHSIHCP